MTQVNAQRLQALMGATYLNITDEKASEVMGMFSKFQKTLHSKLESGEITSLSAVERKKIEAALQMTDGTARSKTSFYKVLNANAANEEIFAESASAIDNDIENTTSAAAQQTIAATTQKPSFLQRMRNRLTIPAGIIAASLVAIAISASVNSLPTAGDNNDMVASADSEKTSITETASVQPPKMAGTITVPKWVHDNVPNARDYAHITIDALSAGLKTAPNAPQDMETATPNNVAQNEDASGTLEATPIESNEVKQAADQKPAVTANEVTDVAEIAPFDALEANKTAPAPLDVASIVPKMEFTLKNDGGDLNIPAPATEVVSAEETQNIAAAEPLDYKDTSVYAGVDIDEMAEAMGLPPQEEKAPAPVITANYGDLTTIGVATFAVNGGGDFDPNKTDGFGEPMGDYVTIGADGEESVVSPVQTAAIEAGAVVDVPKREVAEGQTFNIPLEEIVDSNEIFIEDGEVAKGAPFEIASAEIKLGKDFTIPFSEVADAPDFLSDLATKGKVQEQQMVETHAKYASLEEFASPAESVSKVATPVEIPTLDTAGSLVTSFAKAHNVNGKVPERIQRFVAKMDAANAQYKGHREMGAFDAAKALKKQFGEKAMPLYTNLMQVAALGGQDTKAGRMASRELERLNAHKANAVVAEIPVPKRRPS
jgi:hypothetical protein